MHISFQLVLYSLLLICSATFAEVIVRMEVQQGAVSDNIDLKLFDGEAPITVANFLNYVNDGDYNQSFIHRSVPGFVIQGGGFTFDPALNDGTFSNDPSINDYPGGLQPVPTGSEILNEFYRSNLRGTISMAKVAAQFFEGGSCSVEGPGCTLIPGTGPDSATSQWFVNLTDNSASLDINNGGYTVFGEVLNNGMLAIDTIASQTVVNRTDIHTAFGELPLINFITDPIENSNLVKVNQITELFTISPDIRYGTVTSGSNVQPEVTIKNTGNEIIHIGNIGDINSVSSPFRIVDVRCANSIINPGDQCSFMVLFSPESSGVYTDDFNINIANYNINYTFTLSGEGAEAVSEPDILVSFSSFDYGLVDVLFNEEEPPYTILQIVQNTGSDDLVISSINISGKDANEVGVSGNCAELTILNPGKSCSLIIEFKPIIPGSKYAEISIVSNDPDENPFVIPITAVASGEDDGVPALIEDSGPNNGDGNNDDIPDSMQSNVVTLVDSYGNYVTYITDVGHRFRNMTALQLSDIADMPSDIVLGSGIFDFAIEGITPGQIIEVGIILPPGMSPNAYYIYGKTVQNPDRHWFDLYYDGELGALILGDVVFTTSSGDQFTRGVLKAIVKDGGRGDVDMTVNGVITMTSGITFSQGSEEGSGAANIVYLIIISLVNMLLRSANRSYSQNTLN